MQVGISLALCWTMWPFLFTRVLWIAQRQQTQVRLRIPQFSCPSAANILVHYSHVLLLRRGHECRKISAPCRDGMLTWAMASAQALSFLEVVIMVVDIAFGICRQPCSSGRNFGSLQLQRVHYRMIQISIACTIEKSKGKIRQHISKLLVITIH